MLIIKKEKNRTLAFNAVNGRQVAVDDQGGKALIDYLENKAVQDRHFLQDVFLELETSKKIEFRIIENVISNNDYDFEVLASPALVDLQVTTKCNLSCPHCYANGAANGRHMPIADAKKVIDQCAELGVFEIALGGGEPTLHPDFVEILKYARLRGVVPNLATNGFAIGPQTLYAIGRYAGAVALSIEFIGEEFAKRRGFAFERWLKNFKLLKAAGIKVVFQLTASQANVRQLPEIVNYLYRLKPYGIIFLTFKPYGRGTNFDAPLASQGFDTVKEVMNSIIINNSGEVNLGYDCCLGNALVGIGLSGDEQIKGCSAMRSSLAVNANLDVVPCSFSGKVFGNLAHDNLADLWQGSGAKSWRDNFRQKIEADSSCSSCNYKNNCLGGCPEFKLASCLHK